MNISNSINFDPFSGPELESVTPLTDAQKEIWISSQMDKFASLGYNESLSVHLNGEVQEPVLIDSLNHLMKRHGSLRSIISPNGETMQILKEMVVEIPVIDAPAYGTESWEQIVNGEMGKVFDLKNGPLFRATLYRHSKNEYTLTIFAHHIICDGWSLDVLLYDLAIFYSSHFVFQEKSLNKAPRFSGYVSALQNQKQNVEKDEQYWKDLFKDEIPSLDFPIDKPRPLSRTYQAARITHSLDYNLLSKIKTLSSSSQCSLFATLLTAWAVQIYRLTNHKNVIIGVPVAGQTGTGMEELVGHCVSLLPVLLHIDGSASFNQQIKETRTAILDAYEHQSISFGSLLQKIRVPRNPSRIPLISVCFTHTQKYSREKIRFHGCEVQYSLNPRSGETFELHLNAIESNKGIELYCHYNTALFREETVKWRLAGLETLLRSVTENPTCRIQDLNVLSSQESMLLSSWNNTRTEYPDITLNDLLYMQLEKSPDITAVTFENKSLTLKEIHSCAEQLSVKLISCGVKADVPVGILAERSLEMVIGILAIIKAGGAYVPIEPSLPTQRISFMAQDTCMPVLLLQEKFKSVAPEQLQLIILEQFTNPSGEYPIQSVNSKPGDLAYIIYTSGSTGIPKGVGNTHEGICNRLLWMKEIVSTGQQECILQKTPFGFDVSVWEFFLPLITGTRMVIARPGGHQDPAYIVSTINNYKVTCIHFVPSMLQAFVNNTSASTCTSLKQVVCSGESLSPALRDSFFQIFPENPALINLYGPTEAAVDVTYWECTRDDRRPLVPIGRPVANTSIYILNKDMQQVPIGVCGELFIGGIQVARGYVNRPELNDDRFICDPFGLSGNSCSKLFRTGDIARWLPDGTIDFIGREDFQVKIRGMRIELGEIEYTLRQNPAVSDAVVVVYEKTEDDKKIVGYVIAAEGNMPDDLREYLKMQLPEHMVPWQIITVDAFPLTSNGKLDRNALPQPQINSSYTVRRAVNLPQSDLERQIADIWKDTLKVSGNSIDDNFFDLGGHSLLLTEVQNLIRSKLKHELSIVELFHHPTIRSLAKFLSGNSEQSDVLNKARERAKMQKRAFIGKRDVE